MNRLVLRLTHRVRWFREVTSRLRTQVLAVPRVVLRSALRVRSPVARSLLTILKVIGVNRIPIVIAAISYALLSTPRQVQELYLLLEDNPTRGWACAAVILLLAFLLSCSLLLTLRYASTDPTDQVPNRLAETLQGIIEPICTIAPLAGVCLGCWNAIVGPFNTPYRSFLTVYQVFANTYPSDRALDIFPQTITHPEELPAYQYLGFAQRIHIELLKLAHMRLGAVFLAGVLLSALLLLPRVRRLLGTSLRHSVFGERGFNRALSGTLVYRIAVLLTILLIEIFCSFNVWTVPARLVEIPRYVGSLQLLLIFLILMTLHAAVIWDFSKKYKVPAFSLLFSLALIFDYAGLTDNHAMRFSWIGPAREYKGDIFWHPLPQRSLLQLDPEFRSWFEARPASEQDRYKDSPYPVFVVAAEGGGIYAAAESSIFLARIIDRCPRLRHHLFAISSVSGGSLGASILASLLNTDLYTDSLSSNASANRCDVGTRNTPEGFLETHVKQMLSQDYLSPVVAAGLFPDFFQRFLPFRVPAFDRYRAFERSIEESWDLTVGQADNPYVRDFRLQWRANGNAPMMLINTTAVESGTQKVIAPVEAPTLLSSPGNAWFQYTFDSFFSLDLTDNPISERFDIPLSTAVGLSARFPGVAPPAYMKDDDRKHGFDKVVSQHFVDGGYVDTSGIETAVAIADYVSLRSRAQTMDFHLLIVGGVSESVADGLGHIATQYPSVAGEFLAPVHALLSARAHRTSVLTDHANRMSPAPEHVALPWKFLDPPLGWSITRPTVDVIAAALGDPALCDRSVTGVIDFTSQTRALVRNKKAAAASVDSFVELHNVLMQNACNAREMIGVVEQH